MLQSIRILKFPALLAGVLLMVAGCSSSSGGGGSNDQGFFEDALPPVDAAPTAASARAIPREGSVTQSSEPDDAINVVITDLGEASATYTVTNTKTDGWDVDSDNDIAEEFDGTNDLGFQKTVTGGEVYVGLLTENIGDDADYLAYGLWVYVPDSGDPQIGVFMDSNNEARFPQANIAGLQGDPTYTGSAGGIYTDLLDGEGEVSSFNGIVVLTAAFGDENGLGTITGAISDLRDIHDEVYDESTIALRMADIGNLPGGFFEGATSSTVTIDGAPVTFDGAWGGQFFGDAADSHPANVAGTFGLASGDDTRSILGVFFADLDDDGS